MNEVAFEWDDGKAVANWRAHGVAFHQAIKAFRDPFAIEWIYDRENYGEERINLLGMCGGVILHVTYTEHGEHIRSFQPGGRKNMSKTTIGAKIRSDGTVVEERTPFNTFLKPDRKKSQKTPRREIEIPLRRAKEVQ